MINPTLKMKGLTVMGVFLLLFLVNIMSVAVGKDCSPNVISSSKPPVYAVEDNASFIRFFSFLIVTSK